MMRIKKFIPLLAFLLSLFIVTPSLACFTIIVGKDVSETGNIIVGHNEDNHRRISMSQYSIPRMKHEPGSVIAMEKSTAKIPQVSETWAYFWTQTIDPNGSSFSDSFVNEWGVSIVSNNGNGSKEQNPDIKEGGVGYGIRRLMAERATSAREAVMVAADLLNKYGYTAAARSYEISDGKEAWIMQIIKGNHFVAKRVADNEVVMLPNELTIRKIDLKDTANVIASPDLVEYAIKQGWYKPAKEGDYNDFDFAGTYQEDKTRLDTYNPTRFSTALKALTGKDYEDPLNYPFSVNPGKKLSVSDVKAILRAHTPGQAGTDKDFYHHNMYDVCNMSTHESVIIQQHSNPKLITLHRVSGRPCSGPYIPWFPYAGVPAGFNWMTPEEGRSVQFGGPKANFSFDAERPWWVFLQGQALLNFQYPQNSEGMLVGIRALEEDWAAGNAKILAEAEVLLKKDEKQGLAFLLNYSNTQAAKAQDMVKKEISRLSPYPMKIAAETLSISNKGPVEVILYSTKDFDATKIDIKETTMGVSYSKGRTGPDANQAKPAGLAAKDMNGDGITDAVLTFTAAEVANIALPEVVTDLYLRTYAGEKRIVAMDAIRIVE